MLFPGCQKRQANETSTRVLNYLQLGSQALRLNFRVGDNSTGVVRILSHP